jgi:hypothetical protein
MTRVTVMVADANNPFVPYNTTSVTLSVTGADDFIGESPIAMENGMSAFYVRSRAGQTGTITCSATASTLTDGSATITVVKKPGNTGVKFDPAKTPIPYVAQKRIYKQAMNSTIPVPAWARNNAEMVVYDLSGKVICKKVVTAKTVEMERIKTGYGVRLVKFVKGKDKSALE